MSVSEHRPLAGGAALAAASRVTVAVTGAATTVLVARLLGAKGAGSFSVALTVILMLTTFGSLGIEHGIAYYVSSRAWLPRAALRAALRVGAAVGLAGAGLAVAGRLALPAAFGDLTVWQVALVAGAAPFSLVWFLCSWVALAVDRYERYVIAPAIQSLSAMILVAAGAASAGLTGALVALGASHVLTAGVAGWATHTGLADEDHRTAQPGGLRRALRFGVKGYGANALQFVNFRIDVFLLSAVASTGAVGRYAVAVSVTSVMTLLPQALNEVLFPRIAALSAGDDRALAHRDLVETKSVRHLALIVAATAATLVVAILGLIVPVYGDAFRSSVGLALILLPGTAALGLAGALSAAVVGRGRPDLSLRVAAVMTPITLMLYGVLIPLLGAEGAAGASTLSYCGTLLATGLAYRRLSGRSLTEMLRPSIEEWRDYRALARTAAVRLRRGR